MAVATVYETEWSECTLCSTAFRANSWDVPRRRNEQGVCTMPHWHPAPVGKGLCPMCGGLSRAVVWREIEVA